jgi:hypothetical protein
MDCNSIFTQLIVREDVIAYSGNAIRLGVSGEPAFPNSIGISGSYFTGELTTPTEGNKGLITKGCVVLSHLC